MKTTTIVLLSLLLAGCAGSGLEFDPNVFKRDAGSGDGGNAPTASVTPRK